MTMSIYDKFRHIATARQELVACGVESVNVVIEEVVSATEGIVNGRNTILAGTNNYLGLTFDSECIEAACRALQEEGTGTTGSRMANGTLNGHVALERDLADFFDVRSAIVFSTGYVANLGMLSTVVGPDDVILIDADCHASIYDGCRLGGAELIRFRHNNVVDLEKRLERLRKRNTNILIVVEGIYSMYGDRAPLAKIAAVKNKYGAYLLIDEAHSLGVLGRSGRGLAEEAGVEKSVDFIVGTFSKSLGSIGGYCVSDHTELELVRCSSRPYVFTASPCPSIVASTRVALNIIRNRPELRERLWRNADFLYENLLEMGFNLGPESSPIIAIRLNNKEQAIALWSGLLEEGVYVNMVLPPATPDGGSLLRCSVSAGHNQEQLEYICRVFNALRKSERVVAAA
jgi:8-amino-7-oxononanoate synthase